TDTASAKPPAPSPASTSAVFAIGRLITMSILPSPVTSPSATASARPSPGPSGSWTAAAKPPLPSLMSTETLPGNSGGGNGEPSKPRFATTMSGLPSPLTSAIATPNGAAAGPMPMLTGAAKPPAPSPSRIDRADVPAVAGTRPSAPPRCTSAIAIDTGYGPVGQVVALAKPPAPSPSRTDTSPLSPFAVTMSSTASPLMSTASTQFAYWPPEDSDWAAPSAPLPSPGYPRISSSS